MLLLLTSLVCLIIIQIYRSKNVKPDEGHYGSDEMANAYNEAFTNAKYTLRKTQN